MFDAFLTPWTLLIKALGLALAVASGLSLGKEASSYDVAHIRSYKILNKTSGATGDIQNCRSSRLSSQRSESYTHTHMGTHSILFNASIAIISKLQSLAHCI